MSLASAGERLSEKDHIVQCKKPTDDFVERATAPNPIPDMSLNQIGNTPVATQLPPDSVPVYPHSFHSHNIGTTHDVQSVNGTNNFAPIPLVSSSVVTHGHPFTNMLPVMAYDHMHSPAPTHYYPQPTHHMPMIPLQLHHQPIQCNQQHLAQHQGSEQQLNKSQNERSIWVGNISDKTTRNDLVRYFRQFHGFLDLYYMKQTRSAFVNMATNKAVEEAALQSHGQVFLGSRLICRSRLNKAAAVPHQYPPSPYHLQPNYPNPNTFFLMHAPNGPYMYPAPPVAQQAQLMNPPPVHMLTPPPASQVPASSVPPGGLCTAEKSAAGITQWQQMNDINPVPPRPVFHPCGIGWIPIKDYICASEIGTRSSGLVAPSPSGASAACFPTVNGGPVVVSPSNRYFIIKALSLEDLEMSMKNGVWAPQLRIMQWMDMAFQASEIVYLIFSVNKSGEYFGYARMTSITGQEPVPALNWSIQGNSRRSALGGVFGVKWQVIQRLPFTHVRHLSNQWNNDKEVKVSRDGTELEPTAGHQLLMEFLRFRNAEESLKSQGHAPQYPLPARFSYYTNR